MRINAIAGLFAAFATAGSAYCGHPQELWARKVQPLFDVQCVKCHGPIEQKSGLELDTTEAVFKGGDEGKIVVPGKPEESRLYQYLAPGSDPHMPPKKQLTDADRELVRQWIVALGSQSEKENGSQQRQFSSITDAVDTYITEGWQKRGVQPAKALSERDWCRRV